MEFKINQYNQPGRFDYTNTVFFICDIQEKLRDKIQNFQLLADLSALYIQFAKDAGIPFYIVVFKPEQTGALIKEIQQTLTLKEALKVHEKLGPTMLDKNGQQFLQKYPERKKVFLLGLESHVCIRQTAQDLIHNNYEVYLMLDAVNSMLEIDHTTAFLQMQRMGVHFQTFIGMLLEFQGQPMMENDKEKLKLMQYSYKHRKLVKDQIIKKTNL